MVSKIGAKVGWKVKEAGVYSVAEQLRHRRRKLVLIGIRE